MAKTFCIGCKRWVRDEDYMSEREWYCEKFNEREIKYRRLICGGKFKEPKRKPKL